jgi:carboxylesterase
MKRVLHNEPVLLRGESGEHACLMLHGFGGGSYEMLWLAEHLHERGVTVQTLNYPGHDVKADAMPLCGWEDWYAHILAAYLGLKRTHREVSVVGLSTGCPLALWLASQEAVTRMVLLSPFIMLKRQWYYLFPLEFYAPLVEKLRPIVQRTGADIRDPEMARLAWDAAYLTSFNVTALRSALGLIRHVKQRLPGIESPTLIIQSHTDKVVDPDGARYLMRRLGSTDKRIHWLEKPNHVITLDYDWPLVYEKTLDFLLKDEQPKSI